MASDPYKYFRVEARELTDGLARDALAVGAAAAPEVIARMLRLAHTLKGAARVVKQTEIADRAHAIEDVLAPYRAGTQVVPRDAVDEILRHLDDVTSFLAKLAPAPAGPKTAAGSATAPAAATTAPAAATLEPAADEPLRTLRAEVTDLDEVLDGVAEAHAQLGLLRRTLAALEKARVLADVLVDQAGPAGKARAVAEDLRRTLAAVDRTAVRSVGQLDRELDQVRESAERMRLVSASALFTALERACRDAADAQHKQVGFSARGGDVRLDAHVLEIVQGALVQLVRNAVAHGIESPAERRAAGKPAEGRVAIEVRRHGRRVIFACRDDGRGVDLDAVWSAAARRGLATPELKQRGPAEVLALLLRGGISTSKTVTELAGRGIGLDVVRDAAERLGGVVEAKTEAGAGTTIEIAAPLSSATMPVLMVECHQGAAAIPLDAVRCSKRLSPGEIARTPEGEVVLHDGAPVPYFPLARALSGGAAPPPPSRAATAVIVEGRAGLAALAIDRLLGVSNVVLRPLPALALASPVIAGVYLDGERNPRIVLDPDGVSADARRHAAYVAPAAAARQRVLVIDDSLTTRMLEQSILESAGYDVDLATSGEDGLVKARERRYALFLVDVEMPGIDGFTFIERIRADPALQHVPAILVTSRNAPEDRARGAQVGASGYIVKSEFDQVVLLDRIRGLVA